MTKPFNLEAAKRGDPVVTREGLPVRFLAHEPTFLYTSRVLTVVKGRTNVLFTGEDGTYRTDKVKHPDDLYMATVKRTVYVNVIRSARGELIAEVREKEAEAHRVALDGFMQEGSTYIATAAPVEIEE